MASVVIVHAAEDALPARALAQKLAAMGLKPTIEQGPGEGLRSALREAAAVIALWSPNSVGRADLIADLAHARGGAVHARMQNAATPAEFAGAPSIDLTGWRGQDEFPPWRDLAAAVAERAGASPSAAPRASSGFFQPGAAPQPPAPEPVRAAPPPVAPAPLYEPPEPPPSEPRAPAFAPLEDGPPRPRPVTFADQEIKKSNNLLIIAAITFVVVVAAAAGGYFAFDRASGQAAAAWEQVDPNDARAIRAFLASNPGEMRGEAEAALAALEEQQFDAAQEADTIEAFEAFLADFPDSRHAVRARGRIAELRLAPPPLEPGAEGEEEIDPLTGMPYPDSDPAADPDLVPPGVANPGPAAPGASGAPIGPGGPVTLTPPPEEPLLDEPAGIE